MNSSAGENKDPPARNEEDAARNGIPGSSKRKRRIAPLDKGSAHLGGVCLLLFFITVAISFCNKAPTSDWSVSRKVAFVISLPTAFVGSAVGLVLGLIRLCQWPKRKRLCFFAIALNAFTILGIVFFHRIGPLILDILNRWGLLEGSRLFE